MLFAELCTQSMLRSKRLSEAKVCFRLPDPDRVQAASVALFRLSTIYRYIAAIDTLEGMVLEVGTHRRDIG